MLSAFERQYEILSILYKRRFETAPNLAFEFGVCKSTIYNDICSLSIRFPIYTKPGSGGGVYVMDGAVFGREYLSEQQELFLRGLMPKLSSDDQRIMQTILDTFTIAKNK